MRIAEINMVDYGSTGNIMFQIADCAVRHGYQVRTFSKRWKTQEKKRNYHNYYGTTLENGIHVLLYRMIGFQGSFSYFGTRQLIRSLQQYQPDIIHLHNLHDSSTCLSALFRYLKVSGAQVVWTHHDCWPLTGQCYHYEIAKCQRWKTGCHDCPQRTAKLPVDCSKAMWNRKRHWFTGVEKLTVVTPSKWLAKQVRDSFFSGYPVRVINNGIDLSVFHPMSGDMHRRDGTFLVLGVAMVWDDKKGLDVFIELAKRLPEHFRIVLVGTTEKVEQRLPSRVETIRRTHTASELAEYYAAADVFVNPTREDTFPTTNLEALACGTPVVTFRTGGSPEMLTEACGVVVECDDVDALEREIVRICETKPFSQEACAERGSGFNKNDRFEEYISLYEQLYENR